MPIYRYFVHVNYISTSGKRLGEGNFAVEHHKPIDSFEDIEAIQEMLSPDPTNHAVITNYVLMKEIFPNE